MAREGKIAVFGASGRTGRLAVTEALARGHAVTTVVRPETVGPVRLDPGTDVRVCNVYEGDGVREALSGCDAVISCIGIRRRNPLNPWSPLRSPPDTAARCTENILGAMDAEGIVRIACISAAGVGGSIDRVAFPIRALIARSNLGPAYRDLAEMERTLAGSDAAWLALRPTTLTNAKARAPARPAGRYGLASRVPRSAVASALVDFAEGVWRGPVGCVMVSGGPGQA